MMSDSGSSVLNIIFRELPSLTINLKFGFSSLSFSYSYGSTSPFYFSSSSGQWQPWGAIFERSFDTSDLKFCEMRSVFSMLRMPFIAWLILYEILPPLSLVMAESLYTSRPDGLSCSSSSSYSSSP